MGSVEHTNGTAPQLNGSIQHNAGSDLFRLNDRTVVGEHTSKHQTAYTLTAAVTGGLGSLGVSLAQTLLEYGADVVCTDLPEAPQDEIWLTLKKVADSTGGQLRYVSCDVTNEDSVSRAFESAESGSRYPIRGLVTCAGISGRCPAVDYPVDKFRRIMDINVTGTFLCATAAARVMQRQMVSGSIVMLASMSATNVNQLARSLAAEWGNDGAHPPIRVNTYSPG
ncbi:uncharacterized protein LTR77_011126 [Saxophila tyrrhenica]|uniref:Ketoreductase domain-containing protein n=1 Tax=Saxophila tyrrhenica TaxID=1690608 RepID=A0AAV9NXD9_9PEZI|nr:hypothetical protein LTR77_011126 [Saxophila tyrrhenica]